MFLATPALILACCLADPSATLTKAERDHWRKLFEIAADEYELVPDGTERPLVRVANPVYTWVRAGADGGNYGEVYVWTNLGVAETVACFWRAPWPDGKITLAHELHSLSPSVLKSGRTGLHHWKPKAGVERLLVTGAPAPAATSSGRLQQMRALCRQFSARSESSRGERTELRLLPQPLYRYQSQDPQVVDGALFAYVCSVGADPEVFLQLEARKTAAGVEWHYAVSRFSHMNLFVKLNDQEVWKSVRDAKDTIAHSADDTYWLFHEPVPDADLKVERE